MFFLEEAKNLLINNTISRNVSYRNKETLVTYTAPSPGTYDQQWFWDSCFHSLVWLKLGNKERAFSELQSLFIGKQQKQFFPHMIFWNYKKLNPCWLIFDHLYPTKNHSELIQPPIIGYPLLKLIENGFEEVRNFAQETYEYYKYLFQIRDPEKTGLISIVHPWESGMDSAPKFDLELLGAKLMRIKQWKRMRQLLKQFKKYNWNQEKMARKSSFKVKCVLTNTLLIWGLESFNNYLEILNLKEEKLELEIIKNTIINNLIDRCWNEKYGLFFDLNMNKPNHPQIEISTITSLIPLMIDLPSDIVDNLISHLINENEYWPQYPIPTVSLSEKSFNPLDSSLLWRGPTWINTNYFIWLGLKKHHEDRIARELASKTKNLVKISGFREFYNPHSGRGEGAKNFSWSTLVVLME